MFKLFLIFTYEWPQNLEVMQQVDKVKPEVLEKHATLCNKYIRL